MQPTPLRHRVGRRGSGLLFFAVLDLIFAYSLLYPDKVTRHGPSFVFYRSLAPMWVWAAVWAAVGLVCLWYAFTRCDQLGFTAAISLKVGWGLLHLGGWLIGDLERGYVAAAIWLAFAAWVWIVAGWAEPGDGRGPTWKRPSS